MSLMTVGAAVHVFQYGRTTFWILYICGGINLGLAVIIVYIEAFISREKSYLKEKYESAEVSGYINSLLEANPTIIVKTVSFHFNTLTKTVKYTDEHGYTQHRTEEYTERVNTHWDECVFEYTSCQDVSDLSKLPDISGKGVTRVKLSKEISLADEVTTSALNELKEYMKEKNKHSDTHIDCYVEEKIDNFKERLLVVDESKGTPFWMDNWCFCVATLLWCSWPYRVCLNSKTKHYQFDIKKKITMRPLDNANSCPVAPVRVESAVSHMSAVGIGSMMTPVATEPELSVHYQPESGIQITTLDCAPPTYSSGIPPPPYQPQPFEKRYLVQANPAALEWKLFH